MATPAERTLKFAALAEDLPDAWRFVMAHLDEVGPDPSIHITPVWSGEPGRQFDVSVEGTLVQE